jgi:hypothetical protein
MYYAAPTLRTQCPVVVWKKQNCDGSSQRRTESQTSYNWLSNFLVMEPWSTSLLILNPPVGTVQWLFYPLQMLRTLMIPLIFSLISKLTIFWKACSRKLCVLCLSSQYASPSSTPPFRFVTHRTSARIHRHREHVHTFPSTYLYYLFDCNWVLARWQ